MLLYLLMLAAVRSVKAFVCNLFRIVVDVAVDAADVVDVVFVVYHAAHTNCSMNCAHFSIGFVCN